MQDDAVTIAPDVHKIVYEDEHMRMLDVRVVPGAHAAMHRHPKNVVYVIKGGALEFTSPSGETQTVTFQDGQITHLPESQHAVENKSSAEVHAIQIEFKTT